MATKKRLIDAIAYCKELYAERDYPGRTEEFISAMEVAIADLGDMPTVDAVEVVRCKDCKHYKANPYGNNDGDDDDMYCQYWVDWIPTYSDDFCCYGERKE